MNHTSTGSRLFPLTVEGCWLFIADQILKLGVLSESASQSRRNKCLFRGIMTISDLGSCTWVEQQNSMCFSLSVKTTKDVKRGRRRTYSDWKSLHLTLLFWTLSPLFPSGPLSGFLLCPSCSFDKRKIPKANQKFSEEECQFSLCLDAQMPINS